LTRLTRLTRTARDLREVPAERRTRRRSMPDERPCP
jgi:hypothetical protein